MHVVSNVPKTLSKRPYPLKLLSPSPLKPICIDSTLTAKKLESFQQPKIVSRRSSIMSGSRQTLSFYPLYIQHIAVMYTRVSVYLSYLQLKGTNQFNRIIKPFVYFSSSFPNIFKPC